MHATNFLLRILSVLLLSNTVFAKGKKNLEYYQLEAYHFTNAQQETQIDNYLQNAYLPALHKLGIAKVGVFKPIANDTAADKIVYVLLPFNNWESILQTTENLQNDAVYHAAGKSFLDAPWDTPVYKRKDITLIKAFHLAPTMQLPTLTAPLSERVYELRSYEGPTDYKYKSKVKMFNEGGEIALFKRLNFNATFYGEVLAGAKMPNLMYMTSFNNMADRDAHWKAFVNSPEWKTISAMAEYQHNMKLPLESILTTPAPYSDY
jgi:hypothetical protein